MRDGHIGKGIGFYGTNRNVINQHIFYRITGIGRNSEHLRVAKRYFDDTGR